MKRAKLNKKHIVLPEGREDRILVAASRLIQQEVVEITLLGKKQEIEVALNRLGISTGKDQLKNRIMEIKLL